jgi:hypothetical protein
MVNEAADCRIGALGELVGVLDGLQIPYILEGGALLGAVREKRLLPWDFDVDIAVGLEAIAGKSKAVIRDLHDAGFRVVETDLDDPRDFKISARKCDTLYEISGWYQSGRWRRRTHYKMPRAFLERTGELQLDSIRFRCPDPPESYLRFVYVNWRIPTRHGRYLSYRYFNTWYLITNGILKRVRGRSR